MGYESRSVGRLDEIQRAFFYASISAQNVAKRLVSQCSKWIGYKENISPHIYLWDIRENFRTRRQKSVKGVQVPETALPEG